MSLENQSNENMSPIHLPPQPASTRRGKKRAFHRIPKMPIAVRALWESADEASQRTAHGLCTAILETWVGKASRAEVAQRLGMTRLRLWQLSQQAVAGMLAGLLKQPRTRRGTGAASLLPPEEDPMQLKRRVAQLERELKNFDAGLMDKPRWLVFTKADLLPADEAGRKAEEAVETLGWNGPWMLISSVTKRGTEELMQKVSAELELLEDE